MCKIRYLEGLRGVAALVVVFNHLKMTCFIDEFSSLIRQISYLDLPTVLKVSMINGLQFFVDGGLAVWVFWVLSSYVISIKFFKSNMNYDRVLIGYFTKRYFRLLFPVMASIIFSYLLLKLDFMYNITLANFLGKRYQGWLASFYAFPPNFYNAIKTGVYDTFFSYSRRITYNAVLWTIQNEFLGSLFTFGIFGIVRHNKSRFLIYSVIILIIIKLKIIWLSAFVIGHVLCDYDHSSFNHKFLQKLKVIEMKIHKYNSPVFIGGLFFFLLSRSFMSIMGVPNEYHNVIISVLIVYSCLRNTYYKKFLSGKIPYWLGGISFSLYLIHLPVMCSFTSFVLILDSTFTLSLIHI